MDVEMLFEYFQYFNSLIFMKYYTIPVQYFSKYKDNIDVEITEFFYKLIVVMR